MSDMSSISVNSDYGIKLGIGGRGIMTFQDMRLDFVTRRKGPMALPMTGPTLA